MHRFKKVKKIPVKNHIYWNICILPIHVLISYFDIHVIKDQIKITHLPREIISKTHIGLGWRVTKHFRLGEKLMDALNSTINIGLWTYFFFTKHKALDISSVYYEYYDYDYCGCYDYYDFDYYGIRIIVIIIIMSNVPVCGR